MNLKYLSCKPIVGWHTLAILLGVLGWSAVAPAKDLGTFKSWRSHAFKEQKEDVCSMWSQPATAVGKYSQRGEIFAFVTHRPNARNKVSFEMGYDFKPGGKLSVAVDKKNYSLVTSGSTAWSSDPKLSASIVSAMKAGQKMVVVGHSKRGTKTTDTYSLSGFTAAHRAISNACK